MSPDPLGTEIETDSHRPRIISDLKTPRIVRGSMHFKGFSVAQQPDENKSDERTNPSPQQALSAPHPLGDLGSMTVQEAVDRGLISAPAAQPPSPPRGPIHPPQLPTSGPPKPPQNPSLPAWIGPPPPRGQETTRNIVIGAAVVAVVIMVVIGGLGIYGMVRAFGAVNDAEEWGKDLATGQYYEAPDDLSDTDALATTTAPTQTTEAAYSFNQLREMTPEQFLSVPRHEQLEYAWPTLVKEYANSKRLVSSWMPVEFPNSSDTPVKYSQTIFADFAVNIRSASLVAASWPDEGFKILAAVINPYEDRAYYDLIRSRCGSGKGWLPIKGVVLEAEPAGPTSSSQTFQARSGEDGTGQLSQYTFVREDVPDSMGNGLWSLHAAVKVSD